MGFEKWGYDFDGPYESPDSLMPIAGVYAIWCGDELNRLLDVGESGNVKERVINHKRADCWSENCSDKIYYSIYFMPLSYEDERKEVEEKIRALGKPLYSER